jgi:hypothetical protein
LIAAAKRSPFMQTAFPSHLISMQLLIKLLLQYKDQLADLNKSVDALAEELIEYDLIQSIPGIGTATSISFVLEEAVSVPADPPDLYRISFFSYSIQLPALVYSYDENPFSIITEGVAIQIDFLYYLWWL